MIQIDLRYAHRAQPHRTQAVDRIQQFNAVWQIGGVGGIASFTVNQIRSGSIKPVLSFNI
jgi:hypothetical protein